MSSKSVARPTTRSWSSRLAQRTTRRTLVWAWALCCAGFLAFGVFEIKGPIWFILFALTFAADGALFIATRRVTDRPTSTLDERQQAVRNRAYRTAYLLVFYALSLIVGGAMLLFFTGNEVGPNWPAHPASHPALISGFGVAALQLVSLLPTATIAWMEQDEPEDFD
jgi:hypothetical protein